MKNPVSTRTYLLTPVACLLAFASQVVAQDAPQGASGSSTRINLYDSFKGGEVSYKAGHGLRLTAQDAGDFAINIGGQIQAGFTYADNDPGSDAGFDVRSARVRMGGNVFNENVTYFLQMDPSAADDLVDGWAGWRFNEGLNLRLGKQKMRSGLQADASLSDTDLEMSRNAIATNSFAGRRQTGALLEGSTQEGRLNWHFGAMNNSTAGRDYPGTTATTQTNGTDSDLSYTVGASYGSGAGNSEDWSEGDLAQTGNPDWIGGANIMLDNNQGAGSTDSQTINVFGGWKSGSGIAAQAEVWVREDDTAGATTDSTGFYAQGSYTLPKGDGPQWGGVFRYSMIDNDGPEQTEIALGVNAYYEAHRLKTQLQVRFLEDDNGAGTTNDVTSLDLLFTLMF